MSALIKKSFSVRADLVHRLDEFVAENPGLSLTLIMQQALERWLDEPSLKLRIPKQHTDDDVDAVMRENADLISDLES